jgi:hypothetical protein
MSNSISNVCLSFQCPVKWGEMSMQSATERYCSRCQLVVKDFTNSTKDEFDKTMAASQGRVCGRFKKSQMSAAYLQRIAATVVIASAIACTPEPVAPPEVTEPSVIEHPQVEFDEVLMGDIVLIDSLDTHLLGMFAQKDLLDNELNIETEDH